MNIIECYGGDYRVSGDGEVYNSRGLCMSQKNDSRKRYKMVNLSHEGIKKMFLVHRLVALAFIPNPLSKPQVNHKDGDKHNNSISNLEWHTASENMSHKYHELGIKHDPPMKGKFGFEHNKSISMSLASPAGVIHSFGSGLECKRELGFDNTCFTYAKRRGLPYTFKRGKLKGWTMIDPHIEIV